MSRIPALFAAVAFATLISGCCGNCRSEAGGCKCCDKPAAATPAAATPAAATPAAATPAK